MGPTEAIPHPRTLSLLFLYAYGNIVHAQPLLCYLIQTKFSWTPAQQFDPRTSVAVAGQIRAARSVYTSQAEMSTAQGAKTAV